MFGSAAFSPAGGCGPAAAGRTAACAAAVPPRCSSPRRCGRSPSWGPRRGAGGSRSGAPWASPSVQKFMICYYYHVLSLVCIIILSTHGGAGGHARRADGGEGVTHGVALFVPDNRSTVNNETILIGSRLLIRQELNPLCSFPTTKIVNPRYLILAIEMEFL